MIDITRRQALLVTAGLGACLGESRSGNSGVSRMEAIDFERARISWTTKAGIDGHWRIAATACRQGSSDCIVLAPAVMAGDIFGAGRLPRDPPYMYQLVAKRERHAILREGASNADTEAANETTFSAFDIHTPPRAARSIPFDELTSTTLVQSWPLSVCLKVRSQTGELWTLEFPVNHISTQNTAGPLFQIESGPMIIPQDILEIPDATRIGGCFLSFVFLNKTDKADLLAWGPERSATSHRSFAHFAQISSIEANVYSHH
ncbi:hypothetical protein IVB30_36985 [Bradyrhizobium sp. 200]|uniref:hypothetical protein n=1 Tax=Bradyrhizobium sp. 200 TaxID=2782665 RepID=UPI001FFF7924|nr:hypothetical protein [Bradyrhizobium sp. 200]UPJ48574.1 hypothetical protein IVB30_36985 [Bradyrhizobium sp. 200]